MSQMPPDMSSSSFPPSQSGALTQLTIAAIVLLVCATLGWLWSLMDGISRILILTGRVERPVIFGQVPTTPQIVAFLILNVIVLFLAPVVVFGAIQMLRRKMYGFVRFAAILAMLPVSVHCCCVLGLPMGIWALVTLSKPEVREAFRAT